MFIQHVIKIQVFKKTICFVFKPSIHWHCDLAAARRMVPVLLRDAQGLESGPSEV